MPNHLLQTAREALEPFADPALSYTPHHGDDMRLNVDVTLGNLRRARAAIREIDAALAAEGESALPYDIDLGGIRFHAGVKLSVFINAAQRWYDKAKAASQPSPHPPEGEEREEPEATDVGGFVAQMRADGWSVAVHNDYRLNAEPHTFWLWTHPDGRYVKGEGRTDAEALTAIQAGLSARRGLDTIDPTPSQSEVAGLVAEVPAGLWADLLGGPDDIPTELLIRRAREMAIIAKTGKVGELTQPYAGLLLHALADALTRTTPSVEPVLGEVVTWLRQFAEADLDDLVADGGITSGMVYQQEALTVIGPKLSRLQAGDGR